MNLLERLAGQLVASTGLTAERQARDVIDEIRRALRDDPEVVAVELGFTLGGDLYRDGGFTRSYYLRHRVQ